MKKKSAGISSALFFRDLLVSRSVQKIRIGSNYTSKRLPVKLVYCEEYDRVDEAFYREKQV